MLFYFRVIYVLSCNMYFKHLQRYDCIISEFGNILIPSFDVANFLWTDCDGTVRSSLKPPNTKMSKKMKKEAQANSGL